MARESPNLVVLAGPNGAGKSTLAPLLLKGALKVDEYVNADVIAQGLSGFNPMGVAMEAGRIMLARLRELAEQRVSFAFETTLASRSYAGWIRKLTGQGFRFQLAFLWLPSADLAVARVADRVRMGGHDVPEPTVRRRYVAGLRNFHRLYQPIAKTWRVYDNASSRTPALIAWGTGPRVEGVTDEATWGRIQTGQDNGL